MSLQGVLEHCSLTSDLILYFQFFVELWSIPVVKIASSLGVDFAGKLCLQDVEAVVFIMLSLWSGKVLDVIVDRLVEFLVSE